MVCATIFAIHKRSYNLLTSLLGRHHLQRSNQINKKFSKIITNGESKSDVAVNLPVNASSVQKKNIIIRG